MKLFYFLFVLFLVASVSYAETKKCPGKCDGIACGIPLCDKNSELKYGDNDCTCCAYCEPSKYYLFAFSKN